MWAAFAMLLALPLIAMNFTSEVSWDPADFLMATTILVTLGAIVEIIVRVVNKFSVRAALIAGAVGCALLIWADAAIGIFE